MKETIEQTYPLQPCFGHEYEAGTMFCENCRDKKECWVKMETGCIPEGRRSEMKYFVIFFETKDSDAIKATAEFKKKINDEPITKFTVVETIESNYDFLYNSLIEKANKETKAGDHP